MHCFSAAHRTLLSSHILVGGVCLWLGNQVSHPDRSPVEALRPKPEHGVETLAQDRTDASRRTDSASGPTGVSASDTILSSPALAWWSGEIARVGRRLEGLDAEGVLKALRELSIAPPGMERSLDQQIMVGRLAELQPGTALGYAASITGEARKAAEVTAMSTWIDQDPAASSQYFATHLNDFGFLEERQREVAGAMAARWARTDPTASLAWAQSLPEEVRGDALRPILHQLGSTDPATVLGLINGLDPGYERTEMIEALIQVRGTGAPRETAEWIQLFGGGEEQGRAATVLIDSWARTDLSAAASWVNRLELGPVRDAGIQALMEAPGFLRSPEAAMPWIAGIQDANTRAESLRVALLRWEATDPAGAAAWTARSTPP